MKQDTLENIMALIQGGTTVRTVTSGCTLPTKAELVQKLAALGVVSQTSAQVVCDADWRDENFETKGPRDYMYVVVRDKDDEDADLSVYAVFDYANKEFSYC